MFKTHGFIAVCLLLLGCLVAMPVQAASLHGHVQAKSPFEDGHLAQHSHHGHALHCAMMGHDINKPCPLYTKKALYEHCELASDCPHPVRSHSSKRPGSSSFLDLKGIPHVSPVRQWVFRMSGKQPPLPTNLNIPPDHPPRRS